MDTNECVACMHTAERGRGARHQYPGQECALVLDAEPWRARLRCLPQRWRMLRHPTASPGRIGRDRPGCAGLMLFGRKMIALIC